MTEKHWLELRSLSLLRSKRHTKIN